MVGGPGSTTAPASGVALNLSNFGHYDPDPNFSHNVLEVGGSVFQFATPFNRSANGFDRLNIGFTGNTLGLLVSVTPTPEGTPTPEAVPMTMTPPEDIINDVVAFERGRPESRDPRVRRLNRPTRDD